MNDGPIKIATALQKLIRATPGCRAIRISAAGLDFDMKSDTSARALALRFEMPGLKEIQTKSWDWLQSEESVDGLIVRISGPGHHATKRPIFRATSITQAVEAIDQLADEAEHATAEHPAKLANAPEG